MRLYRHPPRVTLLLLLCATLLPVSLIPAEQPYASTLRSSVNGIHCAGDQYAAAYHIRELQKQRLYSPGIPLQKSNGRSNELRATTLDKTLQVLYESSVNFPENKQLIEQTVIRWNFCSLIDNATVYDHLTSNGKTVRYPSAVADKYNWSGFYAFGLMPHATSQDDTFDFNTPYINTAIRSLADRNLQQRYIRHCLPHPDDEHLYRDYGRNFISRIIPAYTVQSPLAEQDWHLECPKTPEVEPEEKQDEQLPLTQAPVILNEAPQVLVADINNLPSTTAAVLATDEAAISSDTSLLDDTDYLNNTGQLNNTGHMNNIGNEAPVFAAATDSSEKNLTKSKAKKPVPESVVVPIPVYEFEPALAKASDSDVTPITVTGPREGNDIVTPTARKTKGFSGSISLNNSAFNAENTSINVAVSYKPIEDSYWFIRSGFNLTRGGNPLSYTWGIGYDDWHAGTWAVQLNNWGPLEPGDGLDFKNAVAEVSYKLKHPWLVKSNLSSALSLSKPLSSNAALNWGWSWNPYSHWFIRSTITRPLGTSGLDWSYGFGYTRYNNKSLSFEYNNWGLNEFPQTNFKKNALLSLIYRWEF